MAAMFLWDALGSVVLRLFTETGAQEKNGNLSLHKTHKNIHL